MKCHREGLRKEALDNKQKKLDTATAEVRRNIIYIPRGKPRNYKPFWTQELNKQKTIRDQARQKAEESNLHEDTTVWRKEKTKLIHQITQSKREVWNTFLTKLNYKTDGQKAYNLMNKLNNRYPQKQVQPITIRDKESTDDKKIVNYFNTYFPTPTD